MPAGLCDCVQAAGGTHLYLKHHPVPSMPVQIDPEVDNDPRAAYFRQVGKGAGSVGQACSGCHMTTATACLRDYSASSLLHCPNPQAKNGLFVRMALLKLALTT